MNKGMPSYRIGKMVQYGGEATPHFERAERVSSMAWFDQFRDLYWTDKAEAEAILQRTKEQWRLRGEAAMRYVEATDKALYDRMKRGACTQEDCQRPYWEEMKRATSAIEAWEWGKDFIIGEATENASVYRLNTLLSDSRAAGQDKIKEFEEKMSYFGYCTIEWTCTGHTRARWQTESDAAWIRSHHPDYEVEVPTHGESLFVKVRKA